jgi:hypothetical protein
MKEHYSMMDENLNFGRSSNMRTTTAGTSTTMDLDLHHRLLEEDGNKDNMAAPEVQQLAGDVNPFPASSSSRNETSMGERRALLRALRIAYIPPISRGG